MSVEDNFKSYLKEISFYDHAVTLLYWDMRTATPKEGLISLSDSMTYLSTKRFEYLTSDELGQMLDSLSEESVFSSLDDGMKFIVTKMKDEYTRQKRIPKDFYEKFVREQAAAETAWEEAKNAADYSIYSPHLKKIIEYTKQMSEYTHPGEEIYDALLNQYEKGMDSATIDQIFNDLKAELVPFVKKITEAKQPDSSKFVGHYSIDGQKKVERMLLEYIGFDFKKGNTGETEHPFTLNFSSKDVRVSNHFFEDNAISSIFSAIHEGGHAIFEQNVNPDYDNTVAGSCCHMGIHESQSRFYENILGRNKNFWVPIYDKLCALLPKYSEITLDVFYREINHVQNSFIRTEADELTYTFHVILRYEIEKAIFRDGVDVDSLPELWNKKMQEYLFITPPNDTLGILQDVHWSDGSFGYFPSYLLGSVYDAMFLEAIKKDLGDIDEILAQGRILEITHWLNKKIHWYGSTREPKEVLLSVCGSEVTAQPLIKYFKEKYTKLYLE